MIRFGHSQHGTGGGRTHPVLRSGHVNRFTASIASGEFPVSLEITPPRRGARGVLLRRAAMVGSLAAALNVIQRPDRVSSLEACVELREAGALPFWHVATRGSTRAALKQQVSEAADAGIDLVLCLRGDHGVPDVGSTPTIRECVGIVRDGLPDALVGVTANQYGNPRRIMHNLIPKLEAGAGLVQSQPVFQLEATLDFVAQVRRRAPGFAWMPLLMPLTTPADAEAVRKRLGIPIPEALEAGLRAEGAEAGWRFFAETLVGLRASELADAVAVMTLRMDPDAAFVERLRAELESAS